jgi:hypothetical protein
MSAYKNKSCSKSGAKSIAAARSFWLPALFFILILSGSSFAMEEGQGEGAVREQGKDADSIQNEAPTGKVLNLYGREMGFIDSEGNITNAYGSELGSVDSKGTILNVSKIEIGKVSEGGMITNQSGTVLGSVNDKGEVFNVSGNKLGEVKGETGIYKTGGAARLIFFRK